MSMKHWCLAPLAALLLAATASAKTAVVVNGDDDGPGSFRDAIEFANEDGKVRRVIFLRRVTVDLESTVVYSGSQHLRIYGRGSTLDGDGGDFDLFESDGGARLSVQSLDFEDSGQRGLVVTIPSWKTGKVRVRLRDVIIADNLDFGLHVDDKDSAAGVDLTMEFCTVADNGAQDVPGGAFDDKDGIRVDERLGGDLCSTIVFSEFVGNLYDGCELDESGSGHVFADAWFCNFDANGFGSLPDEEGETDPEDGYDIDEAGSGRIDLFVFDCTASDNDDEGFDFDEENGGDIRATMIFCEANGNADEGIKFTESEDDAGSGAGNVAGRFLFVEVEDNGGDGIKLEEFGDGDLRATLIRVESDGNDDGLEFEEAGDGDLVVDLRRCDVENNEDDGVVFEESDAGDLDADVRKTDIEDNDDTGLGAEQEAPGTGTLRLVDVTLTGNGDNVPDTDGVTVE